MDKEQVNESCRELTSEEKKGTMSKFKSSDEVPESWKSRCSNNGYERYIDEDGDRRYVDNNEKVSDSPFRPCARCGEYPNEDGDDFCIQRLGAVMNACCGHGNREGYIQFENGITIRGYFKVERSF